MGLRALDPIAYRKLLALELPRPFRNSLLMRRSNT